MVNPEIFEGLKQAVSKGEPLRSAMMSFYNAGYPKGDIEDAARMLQAERATQRISQYSQIQEAEQRLKQLGKQIQAKPIEKTQLQRVSEYEEKKPKNTFGIITLSLLGIILLTLIGVLISMFVYKEKVIELLTNWFG